jgi:hypothetical protein
LNEDIISEVFLQETERETHKRKIDVKLGAPDCERCRAEESCNIGEEARRSFGR